MALMFFLSWVINIDFLLVLHAKILYHFWNIDKMKNKPFFIPDSITPTDGDFLDIYTWIFIDKI